MLSHLHVKNLALIEEIEVEFGPGLNILTGETGAWKIHSAGFHAANTGSQDIKEHDKRKCALCTGGTAFSDRE